MSRKVFQWLIVLMVMLTIFTGCASNNGTTYKITCEAQTDSLSQNQLNDSGAIIKERLKDLGYKNIKVTPKGEKNLEIVLTGSGNIEAQSELLFEKNEFKITDPDDNALITNKDVKDAAAIEDPKTKNVSITVRLNEEGKSKFASATSKYIGQQMKIYMNDEVIVAPTVVAPIEGGEFVIAGNLSKEKAVELAGLIKSQKPLPVSFKLISVNEN